jgi:tetratricopeptide (TPR) repeat protein
MYYAAGAVDKFNKVAKEIETSALAAIKENPSELNSYYNPYEILLDVYEKTKQYDKAIDILRSLQNFYPNDPSLKQQIDMYKAKMGTK